MKTDSIMKTGTAALLVAAMIGAVNAAEENVKMTLNGAGGSFPAPLYQQWCYTYSQEHDGVKVNYQSIGSSAGIKQIKAAMVDFAGTDAPLTEDEAETAGLWQFPMVTGAVVPVVNLPGVKDGELKLDGQTLADLFQGKIKRWNDERIARLNPGVKLPKLAVTVVRRGDGSGTTFVFTSYLSSASKSWKDELGAGALIKWPVGIAGQKNPGVCNSVARIKGSIGYTEHTYAIEAKLKTARLNGLGPNEKGWPILGRTYLLIRKDLNADKLTQLKAYIKWCFDNGAEKAEKLHYTMLPADEVSGIKARYLK